MGNAYILTDDDLGDVHDRFHAGRVRRTHRPHRGRGQISLPDFKESMAAIEDIVANPTVAMGLGDSGAHVGQIMDASSPTWLLSYWVKTRDVGDP